MEDDSSNDVIAMESEESQGTSAQANEDHKTVTLADRPLMQFFKRLTFNKHLQNTVLTNAQLEDILNKEFNFDLPTLHTLQVEIYVTILKKYLKEWPLWDDFETTTKGLTENYDEIFFVNIMEKKYNNLKSFLKDNLAMAKELSSDLVTKVKNSEKSKLKPLSVGEESKSTDPSGVVLEIKATRDQLNRLIYRQPHAGFNNTIFNVDDKIPNHIRVNTLSLESILNWWSVRIKISLQANNVFLTRETSHELQHLLVNRRGKRKTSPSPVVKLNGEIQIKETNKARQVPKKHILGCLDLLSSNHDAAMEGSDKIMECVKNDLLHMKVIAAPAQYRRYLCKYPYVRYLYSEAESVIKSDKWNYDIQLKETISPMHQFSIGRLDLNLDKALPPQWLEVECVACNVVCSGQNLATQLMQHFDVYHQAEPDWHCTNCKKIFPMAYLAASCWHHVCDKSTVNENI